MDKIDFKKKHKGLYSAKENIVSKISVPKFNYITVDDSGHPKEKEYQQAIADVINTRP